MPNHHGSNALLPGSRLGVCAGALSARPGHVTNNSRVRPVPSDPPLTPSTRSLPRASSGPSDRRPGNIGPDSNPIAKAAV